MSGMKENFNVVVNTNHPLIGWILSAKDEETGITKMKQAIDLALLAQGLLKGEDLTKFIRNSTEML